MGYTTGEAERVTGHPARRRIVLTLMLLGNAGIVSVIASLVIGLRDAGSGQLAPRLAVLIGGLAILWMLSATPWFTAGVKRVVAPALRRWTDVDVRDYVQLLDVTGQHAVRRLTVDEEDWMAKRELQDLDLTAEGVLVLAVDRDHGEFLGAPRPDTTLRPGDTVLLYVRESSLEELDCRRAGPAGDAEHAQGVTRQRYVQAAEHAQDERSRVEHDGAGR